MRSHSVEIEPRQHRKRRGVFIRILEALYLARRREAKRGFRHYRHLIVEEALVPAGDLVLGANSHENDAPVRTDRSARRDAGTQFA